MNLGRQTLHSPRKPKPLDKNKTRKQHIIEPVVHHECSMTRNIEAAKRWNDVERRNARHGETSTRRNAETRKHRHVETLKRRNFENAKSRNVETSKRQPNGETLTRRNVETFKVNTSKPSSKTRRPNYKLQQTSQTPKRCRSLGFGKPPPANPKT